MSNLFTDMNSSEAEEFLFKVYCPNLLKTPLDILPEISERNELVNSVTEGFYSEFNKMPSSRVLQQLSDFLLLDYIKSPNKKQSDEDMFHSDRQLRYRRDNEVKVAENVLDHFNAKKQWNFAVKRNTQEKEVD